MARIDHRDVTYLVLERLRAQLSATMLVLAPHEAAPPGDPTHDEYQSTWCRLAPISFDPLDRNTTQTQDQAEVVITVQLACDPRATGLVPLAIETAAEAIAAALDQYTGITSTTRITVKRARAEILPEPDPETFFRTALVMAPAVADAT